MSDKIKPCPRCGIILPFGGHRCIDSRPVPDYERMWKELYGIVSNEILVRSATTRKYGAYLELRDKMEAIEMYSFNQGDRQ